MEEVLDAFLRRLAAEPTGRSVVLGVAQDGRELHAQWHADHFGAAECVSVFVEVPETPRGRLYVVLCKWSDEKEALVYSAPREGADLPRWKHMELTPDGVRLAVRWPSEETPRTYTFAWTPTIVHPHGA